LLKASDPILYYIIAQSSYNSKKPFFRLSKTRVSGYFSCPLGGFFKAYLKRGRKARAFFRRPNKSLINTGPIASKQKLH